jgi:hypothetical protein
VDEDDLDGVALAAAPDDPAAGPHDRLVHDQPPRWAERASQAVGHRALRRRRSARLRGPGSRLISHCSSMRGVQSIGISRPGPPPLGAAAHLLLVAGGGRTLCRNQRERRVEDEPLLPW